MTGTRTFTFYFGEGEIDQLRHEATALRADFDERAKFISTRSRQAGEARLAMLEHAIALLAEPVPELFE